MKVILSRKGFDMKHGGIPSPILPDGTLLLLPRPSEEGYVRYDELFHEGTSYLDIIRSLDSNVAEELKDAKCFPTPDFIPSPAIKESAWNTNFTQFGPSEGHLSSQRVTVGDIFLFFGWFKQTKYNEKHQLTYVEDAPDLHIICSYLQIGSIIKDKTYILKKYIWHNDLKHIVKSTKHYSIYLPTKKLSYNNRQRGYGTLPYSDKLILTMKGHPCSKWDLPDLFRRPDVTISYHNNYTNGFIPGKEYFQSSNIGQEFVINGTHDLKAWVCHLIFSTKFLLDLRKEHQLVSEVNHVNYPDQDGYIYCRKRNKIMKVDGAACKLCQCFNNLLCNNQVECYWADYMPEPQDIYNALNPDEEYKRVNWLIEKQFIPNL